MARATLCAALCAGVAFLASSPAALAFCSNKWADVTVTCPGPVPYTGKTELTDTSARLPRVGQPGVYRGYGAGHDVKVVLHGQGSGYQPLPWDRK